MRILWPDMIIEELILPLATRGNASHETKLDHSSGQFSCATCHPASSTKPGSSPVKNA
jgi:hypothetical protein